jgi:anti-anti-sigma factor
MEKIMTKPTWNQNILTFTFDERMDSKNSMEAEKIIDQTINKKSPQKIIFDLKNVTYVASAFLRICITIVKKMGKDSFLIINTQPQIKKIFEISGLEDFFDLT